MAYRWHPKNAEVDPDSPRAWGTCDRCGFVWNLDRLQWQYNYQGSTMLQNQRRLVCSPCYDQPNPQDMPYILPPDPMPVFNARPEPYTMDEGSWLVTEDGAIITTQDGEYIGTGIPNPQSDAATAHLQCEILAPSGSVATMYLDIFNGNPSSGGVSVLSSITGSSTRTNIASSLTTVAGIAQNYAQIVIAAEAGATVNTNWFGFYSASISGALLLSGPCSVNGPYVTDGNPVVIDALALTINLN